MGDRIGGREAGELFADGGVGGFVQFGSQGVETCRWVPGARQEEDGGFGVGCAGHDGVLMSYLPIAK